MIHEVVINNIYGVILLGEDGQEKACVIKLETEAGIKQLYLSESGPGENPEASFIENERQPFSIEQKLILM